jgi:hypothetical protein
MKHLRNWGAVYILALLFLGSWAGQAVAMAGQGQREFWAATFENWQSEWLQLVFQAVLLLGAKHWLFRADAQDLERIEGKVEAIMDAVASERADANDHIAANKLLEERIK